MHLIHSSQFLKNVQNYICFFFGTELDKFSITSEWAYTLKNKGASKGSSSDAIE